MVVTYHGKSKTGLVTPVAMWVVSNTASHVCLFVTKYVVEDNNFMCLRTNYVSLARISS